MTGVFHSSRPAGPSPISLVLLTLAATLGLADCIWAELGGFAVAGRAYGGLAGAAVLFWLAGWVYEHWRPEPRLAAMLTCTGFLIGFTAAASVLNAMLLTVAGARIDAMLARTDRALGFDWPGMMRALLPHPVLLDLLQLAYGALLPEIAFGVVILATFGAIASVYRFTLAVAVSALVCIFIWALFPAFGAMSVYVFDSATALSLHVPVDGAYGQALVRMLKDGPGLIAPDVMKGLIGFPSYHAVLALLLIWYFRQLPWLRWLILAINLTVLVATPIEGGHHLVDVLAAVPVTLLSIAFAGWIQALAARGSRICLAAARHTAVAASVG